MSKIANNRAGDSNEPISGIELDSPLPVSGVEGNKLCEGNVEETVVVSASKVLRVGYRSNRDALKSIARSEGLLNSAEDTGLATLHVLALDSEHVVQVDEELAKLTGSLGRASRDVRQFARRMATDKCFLCLFCLIAVASIVLVFWKIFSKRTNRVLDTVHDALINSPATTVAAPPGVTLYVDLATHALKTSTRGL